MLRPHDFFDLASFEHAKLFQDLDYVWDALKEETFNSYLESLITGAGRRVEADVAPTSVLIGDDIVLGKGTIVEPGVCIYGPTVIGQNCHIRHGAYIRGEVIIGDGCVLGHASEIKHSIMLDKSQAPHFAYVGDSILGNRVNLGAGTRLSNLTMVSVKDPTTGARPTLKLKVAETIYDTGLPKFGAILADDVQTGCNVVTNPGCLVAPRTLVYPNVSLPKGFYAPDGVIKLRQTIEQADRI
jgi:NDP-sugar pyrophosphorylase family protein